MIFGLIIMYEGLVKIQDQKDRIFKGYSRGGILFFELAVNLPRHSLIQPSRDSHDI